MTTDDAPMAGKLLSPKVIAKLSSKRLSADSLIQKVSDFAMTIDDPRSGSHRIDLHDHIMSGLSVFVFKQPDLISYEGMRCYGHTEANICKIFNIDKMPSDSSMREALDLVSPDDLQPLFGQIVSYARDHGALNGLRLFRETYVLALDGTGYFSSKSVHCESCLQKIHRNGETEYYHQMVGASIVGLDKGDILPIGLEQICRQDGSNKNDCERNASGRLLERIRTDFPRMKFTVVEDGLSSNAPHIEALTSLNYSYILVAKEGDHKHLYAQVTSLMDDDKLESHEISGANGERHCFLYATGLALNKTNENCKVNFLIYWTEDKTGKETYRNTWVTDIDLSHESLMEIAAAGRSRWKIENETFNTLKNKGYEFEHNFGHGYKNLSAIFCMLMMIAFLIDRIRMRWCAILSVLRDEARSWKQVWRIQVTALATSVAGSITQLLANALASQIPRARKNTS